MRNQSAQNKDACGADCRDQCSSSPDKKAYSEPVKNPKPDHGRSFHRRWQSPQPCNSKNREGQLPKHFTGLLMLWRALSIGGAVSLLFFGYAYAVQPAPFSFMAKIAWLCFGLWFVSWAVLAVFYLSKRRVEQNASLGFVGPETEELVLFVNLFAYWVITVLCYFFAVPWYTRWAQGLVCK